MSEGGMIAEVLLGLALGAGVGAAYFVGLWWTVRRVVGARRPTLWLGASFLLRAAGAGAAFWLLAGHSAAALAACLGGFLGARVATTRALGTPRENGRCA